MDTPATYLGEVQTAGVGDNCRRGKIGHYIHAIIVYHHCFIFHKTILII